MGQFCWEGAVCNNEMNGRMVNGKVRDDPDGSWTWEDCQRACIDEVNCLGYGFEWIGEFAGRCYVHGPGLHEGLVPLGEAQGDLSTGGGSALQSSVEVEGGEVEDSGWQGDAHNNTFIGQFGSGDANAICMRKVVSCQDGDTKPGADPCEELNCVGGKWVAAVTTCPLLMPLGL